MPLFDYVCKLCYNKITVLEKFEDVTELCPKCLNKGLERQLSAGGFTFKNPSGTTQRRHGHEISE